MTLSRIKKLMLIYIIIVAIVSVTTFTMSFFLSSAGMGPIYRFPILYDNPAFQGGLSLIIWVLSPFIGFFLGYLLAPILLRIHKILFHSVRTYGIEEKQYQIQFKFNFSRLFFPALMTVNFALMFSGSARVQEFFLTPSIIASSPENSPFTQLIIMPQLIAIFSIVSQMIFIATYFLMDSGVVYTNQNHIVDKPINTDIRDVGSWFLYFLKGYAGISVIINYYTFISGLLSTLTPYDILSIIGLGIFWPLMPFILLFVFIPLSVLLYKYFEHRRNYIQKRAKNMGITTNFEIIIKES